MKNYANCRLRARLMAYWALKGLSVTFVKEADGRVTPTIASIARVWPLEAETRAQLFPRHPGERYVRTAARCNEGSLQREGQWECAEHRPCNGGAR